MAPSSPVTGDDPTDGVYKAGERGARAAGIAALDQPAVICERGCAETLGNKGGGWREQSNPVNGTVAANLPHSLRLWKRGTCFRMISRKNSSDLTFNDAHRVALPRSARRSIGSTITLLPTLTREYRRSRPHW
jgi:hypothetical protein